MSVEPKPKAPSIDPQLLNQLLAGKKTAGEIEDLLKELRKAFIEHALQGELTDLLGYPKHQAAGRNGGNSQRSARCSLPSLPMSAQGFLIPPSYVNILYGLKFLRRNRQNSIRQA